MPHANPGYKLAYGREWRAKNPGYYREYYAANTAKPQVPRVCGDCGAYFITARRDQRFCDDVCARRWHRRHDPSRRVWNDRKRARKQKRRALKKGAAAELVSLEVIRKRDGNRCGICGRRVSGKPYPHPLSASMDHIVPLSAGGAHNSANVQLAHLACNVQKGNRGGGEQLRLYG